MASHNTKPGFVFHKTPPAKASKADTAEFFRMTLQEDELSIEDDSGIGGDPYNSTGQHVILKPSKKFGYD